MEIDKKVKGVLEVISRAGFEGAIVGGAVRDLISGKKVEDWDLATNAKPQEILKLFKNSFYNNRFGTVGVLVNGKVVEVTTYRREQSYSDRRHPDIIIWAGTLEEDLARRDFTINAIALRWVNKKLAIIDPFAGQKDLKNKIIRTVGEADKRFGEDALRLLRAVRFACTLNFKIELKTLSAIKKNAQLLLKISTERIRDELFKIIESKNTADGIFLSRDIGLLDIFLPELTICFAIEQKSPKRHHIFDVGTHCVMSLKHCPSKDTITRLATLLHDIGKTKVAKVTEEGVRTFYNHEVVGGRLAIQIAKRFNLSRNQQDKLYRLVRWHQFSVNENQTDRALRRFIKNVGIENVEDMMDLRVGDRLGGGLQQPESWRLKLFRERLKEVMKKPFTAKDLAVNGHDVMKILGIKPGPKVGEILNALFEEVLDDSAKNQREYLIRRIENFK